MLETQVKTLLETEVATKVQEQVKNAVKSIKLKNQVDKPISEEEIMDVIDLRVAKQLEETSMKIG